LEDLKDEEALFELKSALVVPIAVTLGVIFAGPQVAHAGTPEVVARCSASPDFATFAACVGGALTAEEATKCFASHFTDC
jgi:hypothetical protein